MRTPIAISALVAACTLTGCAEMFAAFVRAHPAGGSYAQEMERQRKWEAIYRRQALLDQRNYLAAIRDETTDPAYEQSLSEHIAALDREIDRERAKTGLR